METGYYVLKKWQEIHFIDDGIYGEVYREHGGVEHKYYSLMCTVESTDHKAVYGDIHFHLKEDAMNRLLNEPFYYDKKDKSIEFPEKQKMSREDMIATLVINHMEYEEILSYLN